MWPRSQDRPELARPFFFPLSAYRQVKAIWNPAEDYQVEGHDASIGVFSLISWRGEWYVVHLGPSIRPAMEGIVYDPS